MDLRNLEVKIVAVMAGEMVQWVRHLSCMKLTWVHSPASHMAP